VSDLNVGRIEELNREHGNDRLRLPSLQGYILVGDVLKALQDAHAEIARLKATRPAGACVCEGVLETDLVTEYHDGEEGFSHHIAVLAHKSFDHLRGHRVRVWVEDLGGAE